MNVKVNKLLVFVILTIVSIRYNVYYINNYIF